MSSQTPPITAAPMVVAGHTSGPKATRSYVIALVTVLLAALFWPQIRPFTFGRFPR